MKKVLTVLLCGLFVFSVINAVAADPILIVKKRRVRVVRRPRVRILQVAPQPTVIVPAAPVIVPVEQPRTVIIQEPPRAVVVRQAPAPAKRDLGGPSIGLSGGLFGNIPSAAGEIWFHDLFGSEGMGLKAGLRYAQGNDPDSHLRKNVMVFSDGIIFLTGDEGAKVYLAGGLNYLAYTTGQTAGGVGAELYFGITEGNWRDGSFYAEAGYGAIHTGFTPNIKGLNLDFGYKTGI